MITKKDIQNLANLSRITLSEEESDSFSKDLTDLLNYVGQLDEVDLEDVEPTSQVTGLINVFRPDTPKELTKKELLSLRDELLKNSPATKDGFIVVPAVFGESGNE